jgi:hypothetical protein
VTGAAIWLLAGDGRRFQVRQQQCVHSDCWAAWCECGHKLTAHDFDPESAARSARQALGTRDLLDRPDFAHPPDQCKAAP